MPRWKVIARHKWIANTIISESRRQDDDRYRRFTASIFGYGNWRIWQGNITEEGGGRVLATVLAKVQAIKARIAADDESVFYDHELQAW